MKVVSKTGWGVVALVLLSMPIVLGVAWLDMEWNFLKGILLVPLLAATVFVTTFTSLFVYCRIVRKSNGHK